ncbi:MAG: hypothetical protein ABI559_05480 [Chloroflexota bacterium]
MSPVVHNKIDPHEHTPRKQRAAEDESIVICGEHDGELVAVCAGPDMHGTCPWKDVEGRLPCNGNWIAAGGWTLKVADDATACPAAMLGLVRLGRE